MIRQKLTRRRPWRRSAAGACVVCLGILWGSAEAAPVAAQEQERVRPVVCTIPARLPFKAVVLNQERVADPKNGHWLRDLEVELTNTGTRPIYSISLRLTLTGAKLAGLNPAFTLRFGGPHLQSLTAVPRPEDVALAPGASAIIRLPEGDVLLWERWKEEGVATEPQRLVIALHQLSFGDGTGLVGREGKQIPNPYAGYRRPGASRRRGP
jgi:hypothetical protein